MQPEYEPRQDGRREKGEGAGSAAARGRDAARAHTGRDPKPQIDARQLSPEPIRPGPSAVGLLLKRILPIALMAGAAVLIVRWVV